MVTDFDPYEALGIARDATNMQIKAAFRRCAKETHPDKGGTDAAFDQIRQAMMVLTDPAARKEYDETGHFSPAGLSVDDAHAWQLIHDLLKELLQSDRDPLRVDLVSVMSRHLLSEIKSKSTAVRNDKRAIRRAGVMSTRFHLLGRTSDLSTDDITKGLATIAGDLKQKVVTGEQNILLRQRAMQLLEDYVFEPMPGVNTRVPQWGQARYERQRWG